MAGDAEQANWDGRGGSEEKGTEGTLTEEK